MRRSRFSALLGCLVYSRNRTSSSDLSTATDKRKGPGRSKGGCMSRTHLVFRDTTLQSREEDGHAGEGKGRRTKGEGRKMVQGPRRSSHGGSGAENVHSPLYGSGDGKERLCVCPGAGVLVCVRDGPSTFASKSAGLICTSQIGSSYAFSIGPSRKRTGRETVNVL